ncbi:digeranylgeranylglycerophospholipid reductase [Natronobacterium gregoryi]|uniref:FAD dependent oxidoreductase n=2 Tax=Natronobacterium gregoryi TaxID=44930 RepID=L0ADP4_NATGS|nr:digeranylgeranylglycerophospholipid reductase [Natronobacterium gregoryi]AFZ72028.1 flavin-dependent dehydrogenase [Natronobacterium gregoryi SP2]ELY62698.1 FAD dependent oxidoreductase [Natronobacterium gregoryi SP2]PLK20876.1 NAD(P)/FAD-dependent oxidoreductase [Natronobacterium gregoryi SP2]SFJ20268.1 2,3-di-O-geranylgeranylglyceryl phosphate reductase [Natronobacterium gregoryi]
MNDRYDVVIAGAGPAGGQCARDLAARGYDVVVLETESEDEFPRQSNKSTAGTFPSMMSSFGIPDDVVMQYTDSVVLESPTDHYVREQPGAVLEFADFKRFLVEDSREDGAEYRFDARVTGPIMENGEIVGVEYNGDEEVYGEIVVDATGPSAPLAKELGVSDLKRENHAIGIEYEFEGIDVDRPGFADLHDAMMLRLDHEIAPGGYSWIFHTGEDTAKVGLCYIQNAYHKRYAKDGYTIDDYISHWIETDPRFDDAERLEGRQHRGSAHIQMPGQMHTDRFMAIGDTVPTVDPLWGEGIHTCMKSGRAAAATADSCLKHGDLEPNAESLEVYETLWHRDVAPNVSNRQLMTKMLYLAENERYDELMADLNRLDDETLAKANSGNFRAIAKLLGVRDLPMLAKFVKRELL